MVFCHQKPKHCFVACCCALLNQSTEKDQEKIVRDYPVELSAGTENEGMTQSFDAAARVLVGLGLATHVQRHLYSPDNLDGPANFLLANQHLAERVFMATHSPTDHCILVCDIQDDGIVVMDPGKTDCEFMRWHQLHDRKIELTVLVK